MGLPGAPGTTAQIEDAWHWAGTSEVCPESEFSMERKNNGVRAELRGRLEYRLRLCACRPEVNPRIEEWFEAQLDHPILSPATRLRCPVCRQVQVAIWDRDTSIADLLMDGLIADAFNGIGSPDEGQVG